MDDVRMPAPPAGHNQPPPPTAPMTPDQIRAWLTFELEPLLARRDEVVSALAASLEAVPSIENQDQLAAFADNLRMAKAIVKTADQRRTEVKRPFLDGGREIDAWFKGALARLDEPMRAVEKAMVRYQTALAEQARKRAEAEAARARAEAEAAAAAATAKLFGDGPDAEEDAGAGMRAVEDAAAAAKRADEAQKLAQGSPADLVRTVSDYGTTATATERLAFDIIDPDKVERALCMPDTARIRDALRTLAGTPEGKAALRAKLDRGEQPFAGIAVRIEMKALVR
jgi:hypothetical protein